MAYIPQLRTVQILPLDLGHIVIGLLDYLHLKNRFDRITILKEIRDPLVRATLAVLAGLKAKK